MSASDMGVAVGRSLLARQSFDSSVFDEVIIGCVGAAADEANIARIIALRLNCPDTIPAWTVQRNCASGLQALDAAFQSIQMGADMVLTGGCEVMSRAPLLFNHKMVNWFSRLNRSKDLLSKLKTFSGFRPGYLAPDIAILKGLSDATVGMSMGQTAEELAWRFEINRDEMDAYAARSHQRSLAAEAACVFDEERVPVFSWEGEAFSTDDGVRSDSTQERLGKLRSVFDKYGNITAGNSSQISDGACLMVLASEEACERHGLNPIARINGFEWAALDPKVMGLGPVHAIAPLMAKQGLRFEDLAALEINEAFAAQVIACQKALNDKAYLKEWLDIDHDIGVLEDDGLNINGGAIAMGHPVGASGARLALHIGRMLQKSDRTKAIASLCIGGGQGGAICVEKV
jgi:acetyl-CoA C-acetyltransferase